MVGELAVVEPAAPATLFGSSNPRSVIARSSEIAAELARVIKSQKLAVGISGREYVKVEGWTLLGTMLGVFPVCTWTKPLEDGWEARVEAVTLDGRVVGAAEAMCARSESKWKNRDDYAIRSMAQTRATAKALRLPLGFVMSLAGFEATPAEEADGIDGKESAPPQSGAAARRTQATSPAAPTPSNDSPATPAQLKALRQLAEKTGTSIESICNAYQVAPIENLTVAQASDAITGLQKQGAA